MCRYPLPERVADVFIRWFGPEAARPRSSGVEAKSHRDHYTPLIVSLGIPVASSAHEADCHHDQEEG